MGRSFPEDLQSNPLPPSRRKLTDQNCGGTSLKGWGDELNRSQAGDNVQGGDDDRGAGVGVVLYCLLFHIFGSVSYFGLFI